MDQVIVQKQNGEVIKLFSYNQVSGITSGEQVCDLSGQDVVNITLISATSLKFALGDYIDVFGKIYTLNKLPEANKVNDRRFEYDIQFEGPQYDLIKIQYLDLDATGYSSGTNFSLVGNAELFANLLIANVERYYGANVWELGEVIPNTDFINIPFDGETCLQVLQKICDTFSTFFDIERLPANRYRLNIRTPNHVLDDTFIYGRGRGLYSLARSNASDKSMINRLFAYGAAKNLPLNYRYGSARLKMPVTSIFSEGQPYIQDALSISKYGLIEGSVNFDSIFPNRTGTITSINSANQLNFYDATMPFNLTEIISGTSTYLISGVPAKIVFKTGNLAGYEFSLNANAPFNGYDHSTKMFTLLPATQENGLVVPSATEPAFQLQPGDKYTIVDISLPQSYVDAAEDLLEATAGQYLYDNSKPRLQYGLNIDQNYIAGIANNPITIINYFKEGDYVKVKDNDLEIDGISQIRSIKRDLLKHYKYDLTLGDEEVNAAARRYRTRRQKLIDALNNGPAANASSGGQAAVLNFISNNGLSQSGQESSGIYTMGW